MLSNPETHTPLIQRCAFTPFLKGSAPQKTLENKWFQTLTTSIQDLQML